MADSKLSNLPVAGAFSPTDLFYVVQGTGMYRATLPVLSSGIISGSKETIGFTMDGGGSALTSGKAKGFYTCPFAGRISAWSIALDTGAANVAVWKVANGTAVPNSGNVICTGVSMASNSYFRSTSLTNFTNTIVQTGDIFAYYVNNVVTGTELTFQLEITRT